MHVLAQFAIILAVTSIISVIANFIVGALIDYLSRVLDVPDLSAAPYWLTGRWTGVLERVVFGVAFAFDISGVMTAIVTWNLIKLQAHWGIFFTPEEKRDIKRTYVAMLGGLLSILFAILAGRYAGSLAGTLPRG